MPKIQPKKQLLERYDFPEERINKAIWQIEDRKVIVDFIKEKVAIVHAPDNNIVFSFKAVRTLYQISNKEEIGE